MADIHVLGIRHHGPGCARSVRRALDRLQPDIVLVEGPPDADVVLPLMAQEGMKPPVALLVYAPDRPKNAAFYPFTDFSPEWQALRWALARDLPARFIDLPISVRFRAERDAEAAQAAAEAADEVEREPGQDRDLRSGGFPEGDPPLRGEPERSDEPIPEIPPSGNPGPALQPDEDDDEVWDDRVDPIGQLAAAAGYDDSEEWWDQQVERREDDTDLFLAISEAMGALRQARPERDTPHRQREERREAYMRREIRRAKNEGHEVIAVVCGAWHAPVLEWDFQKKRGQSTRDNQTLKGLKKLKVVSTWVPWTNHRLAMRSGYGAGVTSPGWYRLLWEQPEQATMRWLGTVAALLREQDLDVSSAHVIEAVRLAEALAALRGLPRPGLSELRESIVTLYLGGFDDALALVRDALEIGDLLGSVPEGTPTVPLQQDVEAKQRRLRLKPQADEQDKRFDLRKDNDRLKSQLLWQLRILGVRWGEPQRDSGGRGTFWEGWRLAWQPEFPIALIEANTYGNTTEIAATTVLAERANEVEDLKTLTDMLDEAILAALPDAIEALLHALADKAALSPDVRRLVDALPPLARVARYGDVRGTDSSRVLPILDGFLERIFVGLLPAASGIDDDAAKSLADGLGGIQRTIGLLEKQEHQAAWADTLRALSEGEGAHPRVRGAAARLRMDRNEVDDDELRALTGRNLSLGNEPPACAAWLEGFLSGSGLALLHRDAFWTTFDAWLRSLDGEVFLDLVPSLRRAFGDFTDGEKRQVARKVESLRIGDDGATIAAPTKVADAPELHAARATSLLPVLATLMGVSVPAEEAPHGA